MPRTTSLTVLASPLALAVLAPRGDGPLGPLLAATALAAWACTAWLLLVVVLEHVSQLPGHVGRAASGAVRRIAPASVRGLVRVAIGASLAAGVLSGPAALAEERTPTVAGSPADFLDWPGLAPATAWPVPATSAPVTAAPAPSPSASLPPSRPASVPPLTATSAPAHPRPAGHPRRSAVPGEGEVVVQAGDSLWSIARAALGPTATNAQVAQSWPRWWAANREVVGDAPDLIHPGDRLSAP